MTGRDYQRKIVRARQQRKRLTDKLLERWKCAKCGQSFDRKEYRDRHMARKHE